MHVCTVVTARLAPAARATLDSVREHHPDADLHVVDVDGSASSWHDGTVLSTTDIDVPDADLHAAGMLADDVSLVSWLVPRLLRHLVADGTTALFLWPGVRVVGDLQHVVEAADRDGIAVVARRDDLPPDDGARPAPSDLQAAGAFHSVLLAVGPDAARVLDQWIELSDPGHATPWQAAVSVRRHAVLPASTVLSRWNVGPGSKVVRGDGWTLDGEPVTAVDLTSFDPSRPWLLSTTDSELARALLSEHTDLAELARSHAERLAAAAEEAGTAEDRFARTADGIALHPALRRAFREGVLEWRTGESAAPPDPFDQDAPQAFTQWLNEVVPGDGPPITRYLYAIYLERPDLQRRYPFVPGSDTSRLLDWAALHAGQEDQNDAQLVASALAVARSAVPGATSRAARPTAARLWLSGRSGRPFGVNVVGYLRGELGVGEAARLVLDALGTTSVPTSTTSVDRYLHSRQQLEVPEATDRQTVYDTTLLCVNADQVGPVLEDLPWFADTYRIGQWFWEVEEFPATMHGGFSHLDEIWVASDFVREAIAPHTDLPVHTVTPPLPQRRPAVPMERSELGLPPDRPYVLFMFDHLSTVERKNPMGLVEAFRRAFPPGTGPILVIKSINADKRVGDAERLRLLVRDEPDVVLVEDYLSSSGRDALVQGCAAYASLHRSEGLGLTMAEAMSYGKPVIATRYSGNLQFMTDENSYLVPWTPTEVPPHTEPYPAGARWAEPDVDAAAALLRQVFDDPTAALVRGARAAADIAELHSPEAAAQALVARLTQIHREAPARVWELRARRARRLAGRVNPLR